MAKVSVTVPVYELRDMAPGEYAQPGKHSQATSRLSQWRDHATHLTTLAKLAHESAGWVADVERVEYQPREERAQLVLSAPAPTRLAATVKALGLRGKFGEKQAEEVAVYFYEVGSDDAPARLLGSLADLIREAGL